MTEGVKGRSLLVIGLRLLIKPNFKNNPLYLQLNPTLQVKSVEKGPPEIGEVGALLPKVLLQVTRSLNNRLDGRQNLAIAMLGSFPVARRLCLFHHF